MFQGCLAAALFARGFVPSAGLRRSGDRHRGALAR